jgi:hypothetical protein
MAKPSKDEELNGVARVYKLRQLAQLGTPPSDPEFQATYPALFSLLCDNRPDKDLFCQMPRLSLQVNGGDWVLSLSIAGLNSYGEVSAGTMALVLAEANQRLASGTFPWRFNTMRDPKTKEIRKSKKPT